MTVCLLTVKREAQAEGTWTPTPSKSVREKLAGQPVFQRRFAASRSGPE